MLGSNGENVARFAAHAQPQQSSPNHPRVKPMDFDPALIADVHVNLAAVERRVASLAGRRTVKKEYQAAWLVRAVSLMDLTTLAGDDTPERVRRLCAKARKPLSNELTYALGIRDLNLTVGAVCVYHAMVETAVDALRGSGIPVAAVSAGFTHGLSPKSVKLDEIRQSVAAGATEIDIVITRHNALNQDWEAVYQEVREFREAAGDAHLKAILAVGELGDMRNVARASMASMMAGADFIKTSTGKETRNADLPVSLVMVRQIRAFDEATKQKVGYKPAGGIKTAKDALGYLILMKEELGDDWLKPDLFRFGASTLLGDIERQLEHHVTGKYSAAHRHALG